MEQKNNKKDAASLDKYRVEATSANDLDGCATTEATGMIPTLPQTREELNSYKAILPYSPDCYVEKTKEKKEACLRDAPRTSGAVGDSGFYS